MLKKLYIYIFVLVGVISFSCSEKDLNLQPRFALTENLALTDSTGYQGLLLSAYRRMHEFSYYGQTLYVAPDILADNLVIVNNTGRYLGQAVNDIGSHVNIWSDRTWAIINDCNIVIAKVDGITASTNFKNRLKGEALFLRSLVFHDLLRSYSYEPNQIVNGWNKGIILRTTPTLGAGDADERGRSTVQECYTQIKTDLQQAATFLTPLANVSFPYRVNAAAARALLARVLLYEGSYAQAATEADAALAASTSTLATVANYLTAFNTSPNPESMFELELRSADWSTVDGVNNSLHSMTSNLIAGSQFVVGASVDLFNAYETGDVRKTQWTDLGAGRIRSSKWSGEKGQFLENIAVIRRSEMLLTSAEAKARSGNEAGARAALSTLRTNRGLATVPEATTGAALIDLILKERRLELVLEGHRFFDLKRLGLPIVKPVPSQPVPYSDFRVIARIPPTELILNPKLEQNPNY
jgi:starch-binding outer membrane protein, SusD/RagB family